MIGPFRECHRRRNVTLTEMDVAHRGFIQNEPLAV
jgi:hypothetical protein